MATRLFGDEVEPDCVIGETLRRATPLCDVAEAAVHRGAARRRPRRGPQPSDRLRRLRAGSAGQLDRDDLRRDASAMGAWCAPRRARSRARAPTRAAMTRSESGSVLQGSARAGAARDLAELTGARRGRLRPRHRARRCSRARPARRRPAPTRGRSPSGCTSSSAAATRCTPRWSRRPSATSPCMGSSSRPAARTGARSCPSRSAASAARSTTACGAGTPTPTGRPQPAAYAQRRLGQLSDEEDGEPGFLFVNATCEWPDDPGEALAKLPDDWLDDKGLVKKDRKRWVPRLLCVLPDGTESDVRPGVSLHAGAVPLLPAVRRRVRVHAALGLRQALVAGDRGAQHRDHAAQPGHRAQPAGGRRPEARPPASS